MYDGIMNHYVSYIKRYGQSIVVFDGYRDDPYTKYVTHRRKGDGHQGRKVSLTASMAVCVKKKTFLKNKDNKQMFIDMLGERVEQCGNQEMGASGDVYLLIAKTAVEATIKSDTVLVGEGQLHLLSTSRGDGKSKFNSSRKVASEHKDLVCLYTGKSTYTLDSFRFSRF